MTNTDSDVIVVGGGLAGLAAAATAARSGASTVVLEAHQPGGRARTGERNGFVFNNGIHAFFTGGPGMRVLDALGVQPHGAAPPLNDYMLLADGRQHILPIGRQSFERTAFLDATDKHQFAALGATMAALDPHSLEGLSTEEWLRDQDLRPKVDVVMRALLRLSTYVADLGQLGADAALAQQQAAARTGVLYLDGGWAQLVSALAHGFDVRTGVGVRSVTGDSNAAVVRTDDATFTAAAVIVATGTPQAARTILATDPGWDDLGDPVTAACLDAGVRGLPKPGYVVSADDPLYGTVQSPPARQSPEGTAVVGIIRYGARSAAEDRPQLEAHLRQIGVRDDDIVERRFLARMIVCGAMPSASGGGLAGRPLVDATGMPRVFVAGDWVGRDGLLADAALASGHAAARAALRVSGVTVSDVA